jgi:hypothetical protein
MQSNPISLILNMYDEINSAKETIFSFKKFHPESKVIVSGTEPSSLTNISKTFNIKTIKTNQYIGKLHKIERNDYIAGIDEKVNCISTQIRNLRNSFKEIDTEFCYYLHPDHRVQKFFDFKQAKFDMEILESNRISKKEINFISKVYPQIAINPYYGIWGYFRTASMLETLKHLSNDNLLKKFVSASDFFMYDDLLIPVIMQSFGYKVGSQDITWEMRRKTSWLKRRKAVLIHHYPRTK